MDVFVVSDFHIFDREEPYLFNARKERAFCRLVDHVLETDSRLLCAGDIFDFIGLTPCARGVREFFERAVPSVRLDAATIAERSRMRSTRELLQTMRAVFPAFFASLVKLANAKRLDFLPGNHDCDFLETAGQRELIEVLGVGGDTIRWGREFIYSKKLIVRHGNEFDPANRTENGCGNPGKVFTSALYQAVIPALRFLGVSDEILSAMPAVRPEEVTLLWIEDHLGQEATVRVLGALVVLLERNGYFRGFSRVPGWLLAHEVPLVSAALKKGITPARVKNLLPNDEQLKLRARAGGEKVRTAEVSRGGALEESSVVMGHTHVLDKTKNYINLGTWIDHLTGLSEADLANPDRSLPLVHFSPTCGSRFLNIRGLGEGTRFEDCPEIV